MQSRNASRSSCLVVLVAAAFAAEPSRAAEPSSVSAQTAPADGEPSPRGRILNGHAFMPALAVPGALVTTSFTSGLLVGMGQTTGSFEANGQVFSGTFEYAGIGAVVAYEYAFLKYFSARLALTELIYSGITGKSAIVVGTSLQGGVAAGLTFSVPVGDTLRVAALVDVSAAPNFGLTIGNGIKNVVNSCQTPGGCDIQAGGFFKQNNVVRAQPALAASWAPTAALGVTANAAYVYANQRISGTTFTGDAAQLGLALDFDFGAISSVPVGLLFQYSWTAPFGGSSLEHVSDVGGGLFYTGRKNLALGVQVIDRRFAVTPGVDVSWKTFLVDIGMRYYW